MPSITEIAGRPDGTTVEGFIEGSGPTILIVHAGMNNGRNWDRVIRRLGNQYRCVGLNRRLYRMDIEADVATSMSEEVEDVLAAVDALGAPVLLIGHSSGGIVALEALLADPSKFVGAVIYEPPVPIAGPMGGEGLLRAKETLATKGPRAAIEIFFRDVVRYSAWRAWTLSMITAAFPSLIAKVPRQLLDCEAIDRNGMRLDAYGAIKVPLLLLLGTKSPSHLTARTEALNAAIPKAQMVRLEGQGHIANRLAPGRVAKLVAEFATGAFARARP